MDGMGTFISAGGSMYEGSFIKGLKHGLGIEKFCAGHKYEGEWLNDKIIGKESTDGIIADRNMKDN